MSTTAEIRRDTDLTAALKIDGWLTKKEATALYGLATQANGPIVEIGSWQGRSTATLALGSMAGRQQPVYAVDPFIGPQAGARKTSLDNVVMGGECSPEVLRANLDAAGVNGLVRIVPKTSQAGVADTPEEISLLFVDGDHSYESVCRDIDLYLPRLKMGGFVVFHDVVPGDPGVVKAVHDRVMSRPSEYRMMDRVDSSVIIRRVNTTRRTVFLACPGRNFGWGTVTGIVQSSLGAHQVDIDNNSNGFDDLNVLWERALNRAEAGEVTHWVQLHADIIPQVGFVYLLMDEIEDTGMDLISVACAMKDRRGLLNCGLGSLDNSWGAYRRLTVRELHHLPPTFGSERLKRFFGVEGDADKVLLHNTGCFVADLRKPVFYQTDEAGDLRAWFNFPTRIRRNEEGKWEHNRESEDWFFSRKLHELGAKTLITRKISLRHVGEAHFQNDEPWGTYEDGDEATASLWKKDKAS